MRSISIHGRDTQRVRPGAYASLIAGSYLAVGVVYIWQSSIWAATAARTVTDLESFEVLKGTVYMFVTALLLLAFTYALFRRIGRQGEVARDLREALAASERRALSGILSLAIVHDCNNLLTAARGDAAELNGHLPRLPQDCREPATELIAAVHRMAEITNNMRAAGSRATNSARETVHLVPLLQDTLALVSRHPKVRFRTLDLQGDADLRAEIQPGLLHDAVVNLVINAAEAAPEGGRVQVRALAAEGRALIEVHDNGPGIPEAARQRVLQPFYTTKPDGTGLGLVSVRICAEQHGGTLSIGESDLGGAVVRLSLPAAPAPRQAE